MSFGDIGEETAVILDDQTEHLGSLSPGSRLNRAFSQSQERPSVLPYWSSRERKRSRHEPIIGDGLLSSPSRSPYRSPGTISTLAETSDSLPGLENESSDVLAENLKRSMQRTRASLVEPIPIRSRTVLTPRLSDPELDCLSPAFRELTDENANLKLELANALAEIKNLREALQHEKDNSYLKLDSAVKQLRKGYNDKLRESCAYYYQQVKKSLEDQVSTLENTLLEERQQKEELLQACDRFFDKQLADFAK